MRVCHFIYLSKRKKNGAKRSVRYHWLYVRQTLILEILKCEKCLMCVS